MLSFVISAVAGSGIWLAAVPDSGEVKGFYFPSMLVVAFVVGFAFPKWAGLVPPALVLPQFVLFFADEPGDNDGLQLLAIPVLVVILLVLILPAGFGQQLRSRGERRRDQP